MYQSHWGLQQSPFGCCLDPRLFYESPTHEEAMARLHFLVDQRRRLGLLMGCAGSGKSLLLRVFAEELRERGATVAELNLLAVEPAEMLYMLAAGFEMNLDPADSSARLWRAITDRLAEHRYRQLDTVVLLDDADRAEQQTIDQVARLAAHDPSPESRLTIVAAGQRERMGRLGQQLLELAELRIDVETWGQSETADFLRAALSQAGRQTPLFADPAVARLHQLSHGIPRRISRLAELALLAGAGAKLQQIDAEVVESAYHELDVVEV